LWHFLHTVWNLCKLCHFLHMEWN